MAETFVVDYTLIDKYIETLSKKYLDEWLLSENAYNLAVRISRRESTRNGVFYNAEMTKIDGEYLRPEVITYIYIGMVRSAPNYNPDLGVPFETYMYKAATQFAHKEYSTDHEVVVSTSIDSNTAEGYVGRHEMFGYDDEYYHRSSKHTLDIIRDYVDEELGGEDAEVFGMYLEGMDYPSISKIYGKSTQAIGQRVKKVRDKVNGRLGKAYREGMI